MAKVDADLMKQAMLNVVLNGAQAMAQGGELEVRLREDGRMAASRSPTRAAESRPTSGTRSSTYTSLLAKTEVVSAWR